MQWSGVRGLLLLPLLLVAFGAGTGDSVKREHLPPLFQRPVHPASSDAVSPSGDNVPIIGILTQPAPEGYQDFGSVYLPASYPKWVEQGGAKLALIPYNAPHEVIESLFRSVNGVLLTGGDADLNGTMYYNAGRLLVQLAMDAAREGDWVPVWGTCLGLELMCLAVSGNPNVLDPFDAQNISLPLDFTEEAAQSLLVGSAPPSVLRTLSTEGVTMNWHSFGVDPRKFQRATALGDTLRVVAVNNDKQGRVFVSVLEGRTAPLFSVQFHPERPQFEFAYPPEVAAHSRAATEAMQHFANVFVDEARKNKHRFPSKQAEREAMLFNYSPRYVGKEPSAFYEQIYFWK